MCFKIKPETKKYFQGLTTAYKIVYLIDYQPGTVADTFEGPYQRVIPQHLKNPTQSFSGYQVGSTYEIRERAMTMKIDAQYEDVAVEGFYVCANLRDLSEWAEHDGSVVGGAYIMEVEVSESDLIHAGYGSTYPVCPIATYRKIKVVKCEPADSVEGFSFKPGAAFR